MNKIRRHTLLFILLSMLWGTHTLGQVIACNDSVFGSLDTDGNLTIYPEDILEGGPYDLSLMQIFNQETGEGGEFLSLNCDDLGTFTIEVVDTNTYNSCWGSFTVQDKIAPIPYAVSDNSISMNGGNSASITADMIDYGSYDNCEIVSITLSQYIFTTIGEHSVDMILEDQSGNTSYASVLVTVIAGEPTCNDFIYTVLNGAGDLELGGDVFVEGNSDYDVLEVSLDNINFSETVTFNCDDTDVSKIVYVHIEQDGNEYNCNSQVTVEDKLPPSVIVVDFTIDLDSEIDTYTLQVDDINGGIFDNCSDFTIELSKTEFSIDDWGQNHVMLTVTDVGGLSAMALSTVTVLINGESAPLQCLTSKTVTLVYSNDMKLSAEDFVLNYDAFDQVLVSLNPTGPFTESFNADCGINGGDPYPVYIQADAGQEQYECVVDLTVIDNIPPSIYIEQIITLDLINGSAVLTPEMVDIGSSDNCTDIILSLDKTIFTTADIGGNTVVFTATDLNGNQRSVYVTVIVDDGTGCNLAFVLFPENIEIFDENGKVDNLSIDNLQSVYGYTYEKIHPYTLNECEGIVYTYEDLVIPFDFGMKVIRTWTALESLSEEVLTYIQVLKLYTNLENLVTVSTGTNRPMPGVIINNTLVTNMEGVVFVENDPVNTIQYEDPKFNGLNVLDLILIRRQVLGAVIFDESSELAGDINLTNGVSSLDQVLVERHLLGYEAGHDFGWRFYDKVLGSQNMKGSYMGIKPGDVDDSALLEGDDPLEPVANFEVNDMKLIEGEMYSAPIYLEKQYTALGIEFRANIDNDLINISDISSDLFSQFNNFNVTDEGILTVLFYHSSSVEEFGGDLLTPVFNIEFEAKENSSLAQALDMDSHFGYLASSSISSPTSSLELIVLGGKILNEGVYPTEFICDFLPRTAEFGDCESGHTSDDDVEWPADIEIEDYRISPAELIEFSLIDVLDSEPIFYNSPDDYESSYQDLVIDLTSTSLTIGRIWTVKHTTYGFTWSYNQSIVVDFSEFENLVTVNTGTNRAMPGVEINDIFSTNMQGVVYLNASPVNSIKYEDDFLNGLNILDLVWIQRHILGLNSLDEYGILAADGNLDGGVKASDLIYLRNRILGIVLTDFVDWRFYEKEIVSEIMIEPKAAYVGVKAGDVDDNALLEGDDPFEAVAKFKANDILLNNGETYSVPVYLEEQYNAFGIQYRANIDVDLVEINDITSEYATEGLDYYVNEDGILTLMFSTIDPMESIGGASSNPIFTIEVKAKENSLLSLSVDLESHVSYLATSSLELVVLGGELEGMIGTGTNSEELNSLSVYPNPAVNYLNIDMKNVKVKGNQEISVFGLDGQKIFTKSNIDRLDVSDLNSGMYYYQVKIGSYSTTGKFIVIDR